MPISTHLTAYPDQPSRRGRLDANDRTRRGAESWSLPAMPRQHAWIWYLLGALAVALVALGVAAPALVHAAMSSRHASMPGDQGQVSGVAQPLPPHRPVPPDRPAPH